MSDKWEDKEFYQSFQKWFYKGEKGFWPFLGRTFMWLIVTPFVLVFYLLAYILEGPGLLWEHIKKMMKD